MPPARWLTNRYAPAATRPVRRPRGERDKSNPQPASLPGGRVLAPGSQQGSVPRSDQGRFGRMCQALLFVPPLPMTLLNAVYDRRNWSGLFVFAVIAGLSRHAGDAMVRTSGDLAL
jgi:hypothetical protein